MDKLSKDSIKKELKRILQESQTIQQQLQQLNQQRSSMLEELLRLQGEARILEKLKTDENTT